jgi:beta-lactamase class A
MSHALTPPAKPTRRQLLAGAVTSLSAACTARQESRVAAPPAALPSPSELERAAGGRLGVLAIDTATGRQLAHREGERFAMCSTFKWVLVAAILAEVDHNRLSLDDRVRYGRQDLLEYAPIAAAHVREGAMTVGALAGAAITLSDNTAANLLLTKLGGPAGLTRFIRAQGDTVTRLDRNEPTLNDNTPGDPRDTTTPRAMVGLMRGLLCDSDALSAPSRARLLAWMRGCQTGTRRLRAGLPADWAVGDKTGSGRRNAINDVALAVPPGRAPIIIASYASDSTASVSALEAIHAAVGRLVAHTLSPSHRR